MKNHSDTLPALHECLIAFYTSWHDVDWNQWIAKAELSLDIIVYYWDKWTESHFEELSRFLSKPKTKIRFFFANESDPALLKSIHRLFPDHTTDKI
jgi:hypothetical protein